MYEDLVEKLVEVDEAVATEVSPEKKMKEYHARQLNGPLKKSTFPGLEGQYMKFWLLTDGTIIPVVYTHIDTAMEAGTRYSELCDQGALAGYINTRDEEAGLRNRREPKLTTSQISKMKQLYDKYGFEEMFTDLGFAQNDAKISSGSELTNYLRYGKGKVKKAWEAVETAIEVPEYLYHGTFKPLLDKIKSEGLRIEGTVKNYSDSEEGLIYLAKTFEEAEAFAEVSEAVPDEWIDQIVVLKIDTDKLDKSKLADDPNVRDMEVMTFIYPQDIPPEALEAMMPSSGLDEASYTGIAEAGWIHPNGKFEEIPNYTMGDHELHAYAMIHPGRVTGYQTVAGTKAYFQYLSQGHIRYIQSNRGFNIEVGKRPTESQMRAIRKGIKENKTGEFYFSVFMPNGGMGGGDSWVRFIESISKLP